ncbi:aminotransferase class V-fold PLP-dependent enzyme [Peribacillus frigoritolerans]|nr:aminotransferase class V-fold PLP-dependent enzyme [Peribacillus frigoritolerans]
MRSGTENVISIVGLGEASAKIRQEFKEDYERIQAYKNLLLKQLIERIPYTCINGSTDQEHVLNNTVNISFENVRGEAVAALLNQIYGIAVSVGSACSSNKQASLSHVLTAIGLSEAQIRSSIRISIGKYTQKDDVFFLINALEHVVSKLRRMIPIEQNNFVQL